MDIFIIGASGRVGRALTEQLVKRGHFVYAGARNPSKVYEHKQVEPIAIDLHDSVEKLAEAYKDAEVVYFTAGTNGRDLLQTEAYGAVKAIQAAEMKGIKRYIQLSGFFATRPNCWDLPEISGMKNYYIAKFFADHWLMDQSNLDYTILQPSRLMEVPATGKIQVGVEELGENSITDVAEVLSELLNYPNTVGKVIIMSSGSRSISEVLITI